MSCPEYLLNYGALGDFGRFYPVVPLVCRRGQRAVVRSPRGVELATVLGEARPGHAAFLPNTTVGQLLRLATREDEEAARVRLREGERLIEAARSLAAELGLPLEVIDAEVLLDGEHAIVHVVRWADFDPRPFVSGLSRRFEVHLALEDLTASVGRPAEEPEHAGGGCGRPGCGQESGGGGCGTSGGCSTCGIDKVADIRAYFARLRAEKDQKAAASLP